MKKLLILSSLFFSWSSVFCQNNSTHILESIQTISPSKVCEWNKDTGQIMIEGDFDGDGITDVCGLYEGVSDGVYIFGGINQQVKLLHHEQVKKGWLKSECYQVLLSKGSIGEEIVGNDNVTYSSKNEFIKVNVTTGEVYALFSNQDKFIMVLMK